MDLPGPYYNTNAPVRDLERPVNQLPEQTSEHEPAAGPRSRARTARQLNAEETEQLIAGCQAGAKLREPGSVFGIHPETAGLILRRSGVDMRPNGFSPQRKAEAERLYASGLSLKRVGERLRVDGETVRRALISHGVRLRDPHGRPR